MNYKELNFIIQEPTEIVADILSAELADIGFESFINNEEGLVAYINASLYDEEKIYQVIENLPIKTNISFSSIEIESKNWNEEWEKNYFKPIVIDNQCIIHSSFHQCTEESAYKIIIDPKMSFGTGHHETTKLMIKEILKADFSNKTVLDMGCGTSVLAILASLRGAKSILAIDIDEWCFNNSLENILLNNIKNITVKQGDASLLKNHHFDIILANINRNILMQDIQYYATSLNEEGELYMSGFYKEDISYIKEECAKHQLEFCYYHQDKQWVVTKFKKGK